MSELMNARHVGSDFHWKLLTSASALALTATLSSANMASAADSDRPLFWIELDGQFVQQADTQEAFLPPFLLASPFDGASLIARKKAPPSIWDEGAKIVFEPAGTDWVLSAGIRYGKSSRSETRYQETTHIHGNYHGVYSAYQASAVANSEKHLIADFQAGKDIGLGRFGEQGISVVSIGVRYAQFDSRSNMSVKSITAAVPVSYYIFHGSFAAKRKFKGVGPSLSWDASANLVGNAQAGSLALDWGANGALLFGRQRMNGHHEKTALYQPGYAYFGPPRRVIYQTSVSPSRSKSVTVPNLGGFAAISLRYSNAKISLGYRADMFFGAMDGGIDVTHHENRGFYGPFAMISVGVGG